MWVWILLTGPVDPQVRIGTHFGGVYLHELSC
jgi:hypothetical protein